MSKTQNSDQTTGSPAFHAEIDIAKIEHPLIEAGRMFARNISAVIGALMLLGIIFLTLVMPTFIVLIPLTWSGGPYLPRELKQFRLGPII